ncbi:MAG TPA: PLP-dependent aminotransferase family protein [Actinocrinis sp.]|nr:PLP-dependent aminotransferase family protein [Actinocrinis sp.]
MNGLIGGTQLAQLLGPWRTVDRGGNGTLHTALAERIKGLILDGRVPVGVRLPAERGLADALALSRTTVTAAYAQLRDSGHATSRHGSGTFTSLPDQAVVHSSGMWRSGATRTGVAPDDAIDLLCAAPVAPLPQLREATLWAADHLSEFIHANGYSPYGLEVLRQLIAQRYTDRGVPTSADQILVTAGAQGAITLAARLLCRGGDRVVLETPTYPNAADSLRNEQVRLVPVPVDGHGWAVGSVERALAEARPRLAYLMPFFHNPTGALMPPEQQRSIAAAAHKSGTWLLVDETVLDTALDVPVPAPFSAAVRPGDQDQVLTCGSMAKSFWGGLRIGWLRGSARVIHELAAMRAATDLASPVLDQLIAIKVLRDGETVVDEHRARWREQRAALVVALTRTLPKWTYRVPGGGLSLWVRMDREDSSALALRAQTHGVWLHSGPRFGVDAGTLDRYLRIPYTLGVPELEEAIRRIALARDGAGTRPTPERRADLVA